jgi:cold shock CspA family protein
MSTETQTKTTTNGRVKWFNNKAGYGFITVQDCETKEERDIFVHHSELRVEQTQYKYLVQGEYVEFSIAPLVREGRDNDVHATSVRGVNGGKLMCETRTERIRNTVSERQQRHRQPHTPRQPTQQSQHSRPHLSKRDETEWMIVPRRRVTSMVSNKRKHEPTVELQ